MAMKPKLDRWLVHGNILVGYIYEHKAFAPGTRIMTDVIVHIDPINFEARCSDGDYKLGEPGTEAEHNQPLLGQSVDKDFQYKPGTEREKKIIIGCQ